MNTYKKYCPCVYVAECDEPHEKGDVIPVTTHYGKDNNCIIHNLVLQRDGKTQGYKSMSAEQKNFSREVKSAGGKAYTAMKAEDGVKIIEVGK